MLRWTFLWHICGDNVADERLKIGIDRAFSMSQKDTETKCTFSESRQVGKSKTIDTLRSGNEKGNMCVSQLEDIGMMQGERIREATCQPHPT
jgi:hypothetical protein